jgi:NTP pyrophosphatase (non-canonical NTP hydrolase)
MNFADLQARAHATANLKGWHDRPLRDHNGNIDHDRVLAKIALIHSEITEACMEAFEGVLRTVMIDGKPCGLPVELADIVIRVADLAGALDLDLQLGDIETLPWSRRVFEPKFIAHHTLRFALDEATEAVREDDISRLTEALARLVLEVFGSAQFYGVAYNLGLAKAIEVKMAFNDTRPHRHGGKHA